MTCLTRFTPFTRLTSLAVCLKMYIYLAQFPSHGLEINKWLFTLSSYFNSFLLPGKVQNHSIKSTNFKRVSLNAQTLHRRYLKLCYVGIQQDRLSRRWYYRSFHWSLRFSIRNIYPKSSKW